MYICIYICIYKHTHIYIYIYISKEAGAVRNVPFAAMKRIVEAANVAPYTLNPTPYTSHPTP